MTHEGYTFAHVPIVRIFAMVAMAHHAASLRYCSGQAAGYDEAIRSHIYAAAVKMWSPGDLIAVALLNI